MNDIDLTRRVGRFLRGERRTDDLHLIFLNLRDRTYGRTSIREIGDFVAHRDQRDKGQVTDRIRDMFLGFEAWVRGMGNQFPTLETANRIAAANLRIATEAQLNDKLNLRRETVKSVLGQAVKKLEKGKSLTDRERKVFNYLGSTFIWNAAFTDRQVAEDLFFVLCKIGVTSETDRQAFDSQLPFLTLFVTTLMHGSAVTLENDSRVKLIAGITNRQGLVEVKALLELHSLKKPIYAPICIFWTELLGKDYCSTALLDQPTDWSGPIEIDTNGKLATLV